MIAGSVDFTLTWWWAGGSQDISPKKRKNILLAGLGPCFLLRLSPLFFFSLHCHVHEISRNVCCLANLYIRDVGDASPDLSRQKRF